MKPGIKPTQTKQSQSQKDKRFHVLDITMKQSQYRQNSLIEVLHKAQASFGYLDKEVLTYVARQLKLPLSYVHGVATFYHLFFLEPNGVHTCFVCLGTACYVKGSDKILASLEKETGISAGKTTENGQISLLTARCLGACGIAPAIIFDGTVAGHQTSHTACKRLQQWQGKKQE